MSEQMATEVFRVEIPVTRILLEGKSTDAREQVAASAAQLARQAMYVAVLDWDDDDG